MKHRFSFLPKQLLFPLSINTMVLFPLIHTHQLFLIFPQNYPLSSKSACYLFPSKSILHFPTGSCSYIIFPFKIVVIHLSTDSGYFFFHPDNSCFCISHQILGLFYPKQGLFFNTFQAKSCFCISDHITDSLYFSPDNGGIPVSPQMTVIFYSSADSALYISLSRSQLFFSHYSMENDCLIIHPQTTMCFISLQITAAFYFSPDSDCFY